MSGLKTQNLMEILKSNGDVKYILENNTDDFITQSLSESLTAILRQKGLSRARVIRNAMLNPIYGQQIFSGVRTPSRDKLLAIVFGLNLDLKETDILLKQHGYARLYPRNERDAVVIYGILHNLSILDVNTLLYENDFETLT